MNDCNDPRITPEIRANIERINREWKAKLASQPQPEPFRQSPQQYVNEYYNHRSWYGPNCHCPRCVGKWPSAPAHLKAVK
jgi:hypothetical protein